MIRSRFKFLAVAAVVQLASAASSAAQTGDIRYLASPGAPAKAFPRFERPVAEIVSPRRSTEVARDANQEAQQLARLMGLRSGMVVGDIGAGAGYHAVSQAFFWLRRLDIPHFTPDGRKYSRGIGELG